MGGVEVLGDEVLGVERERESSRLLYTAKHSDSIAFLPRFVFANGATIKKGGKKSKRTEVCPG